MQFLCVGIGRVLSPPPPRKTNGNDQKLTSIISSCLRGIKPPGILLDVLIVIFINLCTYAICRYHEWVSVVSSLSVAVDIGEIVLFIILTSGGLFGKGVTT